MTSRAISEAAHLVTDTWVAALSTDTLRMMAVACGTPTRGPQRRLPRKTVARKLALALLEGDAAEIIGQLDPGDQRLMVWALSVLADRLGARDPLAAARPALKALPHMPMVPVSAHPPPGGETVEVRVLKGAINAADSTIPLKGPLQIFTREVEAQLEVGRVFESVTRKKLWLPSGWRDAPARTRERFAALLEGEDFPRELRARTWPRLVVMSDFVEATSKVSYALTEAAAKVSGWSPREQLQALFRAWLFHPDYESTETLVRVSQRLELEDLRRRTDPRMRRLQTVVALSSLPPGQWVDSAHLLAHLFAHEMLPPVAPGLVIWGYDPGRWMAYRLADDDPRGEPWRMGAQHLLADVLEVMGTLGVVDVALAPRGPGILRRHDVVAHPEARRPVPFDRLTHVRLTELGAWLLDPWGDETETGGGGGDLDKLADLLLG